MIVGVFLIFISVLGAIAAFHDAEMMRYSFNRDELVWLPITEARKEHNRMAVLYKRETALSNKKYELVNLIDEAERIQWPTNALEMKLESVKCEIQSIEDAKKQRKLDEFSDRYIKAIEGE